MASKTRRLIVLRHAKSDWDSEAKGDHARPLDDRGRRSAPRIAERLRTMGWVPQVVISSDAARTRETWACMQPALGAPAVSFTRTLYLMGIDEIRAALREQAPEVDTVMVLGHNPGWEDAVHELSGVRVRMTTCNAALLQCPVQTQTWADAVARSDWTLEKLLRPKEL